MKLEQVLMLYDTARISVKIFENRFLRVKISKVSSSILPKSVVMVSYLLKFQFWSNLKNICFRDFS